MIEGVQLIDVSVWQGNMNWELAARMGVKGAIIRAGSIDSVNGEPYRDSQLLRNMELAPKFMQAVGYYFYFRPKFDAKLQADYFCSLIEAAPGTIYPVMDFEERGTSTRQANDSAWKFCDQVEKNLGRICMIYTNPNSWANYIYHDKNRNWAYLHPLWIANWERPQGPIIPDDWRLKGQTYKFWQYDSLPDGPAYGAQSKSLDHNVYNGTQAEFEAEFMGVTPPPPPPPPVPGCPKLVTVDLGYDDGSHQVIDVD